MIRAGAMPPQPSFVTAFPGREPRHRHPDGLGSQGSGPPAPSPGWARPLNRVSGVWFTLSHGILNEVYYPHLDQACIRDLGLIVTDGKSFFSEE